MSIRFTGNIVGSRDLIARLELAARVSISALRLIIFSCVIKIFLQAKPPVTLFHPVRPLFRP